MSKDPNTTVLLDDEDVAVNRIAVRIPPFWPDEPELWFAQLEGQLTLSNVTDESIKFAQVLLRIEPKQAREVKDIIKAEIRGDKKGSHTATIDIPGTANTTAPRTRGAGR